MKATVILLLLLVWQTGFSQWNDNFGDGDFSINPAWSGNTVDYSIVNSALRLSAPAVSGSAYLSTPSGNINNATWQVSVNLDFNPSSNNYAKIYLAASNSNLEDGLNGYFVKIGGSTDEISLYRQSGLQIEEIIDGTDGRTSLFSVSVQVFISRSEEGQWQLSSRLDGEVDWFVEGNVLDNNYFQSSFFGVSCVFTSTRSTKFSFDNIVVTGEAFVDLLPPEVDTVYSFAGNKIIVKFNEAIENVSSLTPSNYLLNNQTLPISIVPSSSSVELEFANSLEVFNNISLQGIKDVALNSIRDTVVQFIYIDSQPVAFGDIIINEIMADPTPGVGLPEIEYVELYNTSEKAIQMTEWSYSDRSSIAGLDNILILPDSFLILCSKANVDFMESLGNVVGISPWPSLNNTGDSLSLTNKQGNIIDVVVYDDSWYKDPSKQGGGWGLERVNPDNPCSGYLNWRASTDVIGGTPGENNSVLSYEDSTPPTILSFQVNVSSLLIMFDEPLSNNIGAISITPINNVEQTIVNYNQVLISTSKPFISEQINSVDLSSVADCFNNISQNLSLSFTPDFEPPQIDTVFSNYPNTVEVYFNENIQTPLGESFLIENLGLPSFVEQDNINQSHLTLYYDAGLVYAEFYTLRVDKVSDEFNNMTDKSFYLFNYRPIGYPDFSEILITEIMADPSPSVNLPEYEYIELTNKTSKRLLLKGLVLADAKDKVIIPSGIIEPNERVLLTKTSGVEAFSNYAKTIGVPNWPTLNNTSDQIMILDTGLQVVHHVSYTNDWYDNEEKKEGGWALELIDETNFCSGNKVWTASNNPLGGTPGAVNSIQSAVPDLNVPHISEAFAITTDSIIIEFDEPLSAKLPVISISTLQVNDYYFSKVSQNEITLYVESMQPRVKYEILMTKIKDCVGNINNEEKVSLFLPEIPELGDVLLSEILFNPRNTGVDFIEIYNNSAKYISLKNWQISNSTSIANISAPNVLFPYSFRVLTSSPQNILTEYPNAISEAIFEQDTPSMPNEKGNIVLLNEQLIFVDSIGYTEDWHYPYLASVDGISLERISYNQPSGKSSNWASAAETENYATPGYRNSQSVTAINGQGLSVSPKVIVPDANGIDDYTTISLSQVGSMATITIYNLQGQTIKQIVSNSLVGSTSTYIWDGSDSTGGVVALGHYIIVANTISANGTTQTFREKVVVGTGF